MSRRRTPSTASCWAGSNSTNARTDSNRLLPCSAGEGDHAEHGGGGMFASGPCCCRPSGSHRSPPPPHSGGGTRRLSLIPLRREAEAQCLQPDKALGVALVVNLVFLEGDVREAVEAVRRLSPDDRRRTLIEFQPDATLDLLLALVDRRLQHLALRREPEA